jgi:hypothetical protein
MNAAIRQKRSKRFPGSDIAIQSVIPSGKPKTYQTPDRTRWSSDASALARCLIEADDHGLLGWYFAGTGQHTEPFASLRLQHPSVWDVCAQAISCCPYADQTET